MRLLTCLAVVGLCLLAMWSGGSVLRFVRARSLPPEQRAEAVRPWIGTPGLGSAALEASLELSSNTMDFEGMQRRARDLTALLSVQPLSAENWLSLAQTQLVLGQSYDQVLSALAMSSLAGPNEGGVMLQRGLFGIVQWDFLPTAVRRRTVDDLAGAILGNVAQGTEVKMARPLIAAKSAATRSQIRELLQADGMADAGLVGLGL